MDREERNELHKAWGVEDQGPKRMKLTEMNRLTLYLLERPVHEYNRGADEETRVAARDRAATPYSAALKYWGIGECGDTFRASLKTIEQYGLIEWLPGSEAYYLTEAGEETTERIDRERGHFRAPEGKSEDEMLDYWRGEMLLWVWDQLERFGVKVSLEEMERCVDTHVHGGQRNGRFFMQRLLELNGLFPELLNRLKESC